MRRSKEDAARTRQRIVETAARLFRGRGIEQVSVADVMSACGLTVGGFYRHFASKQALAAEAIELASVRLAAGAGEGAAEQVCRYVSLEHARHPEGGCPVAALASQMHRERGETRRAFDDALKRLIDGIPGSRVERLRIAAAAVGAVVLARSSEDDGLSQDIIKAVREGLLEALSHRAPGSGLSPDRRKGPSARKAKPA
jgi:TetR/AcrR family transcriptional repressor of nem operon